MRVYNKIALSAMAVVALLSTSCKSQIKTIDSNKIGGTWFVTEPGDSIWRSYTTIDFDSENRTFGAYNSCNRTTGSFDIVDGNYLKTESDGISTLRYCPCETFFGYTSGQMLFSGSDETETMAVNNYVYRRIGPWMLSGNWTLNYKNTEMSLSVNTNKKTMTLLVDNVSVPFTYKTSKSGNATGSQYNITITPTISKTELNEFPEQIKDVVNVLSEVRYYKPGEGMCQINITLSDSNERGAIQIYRDI